MLIRNPAAPILLLATAVLFGSDSSIPVQDKPQQLRGYGVTVTSVTLAVTVTDKRGRYVKDLTEADFSVFENGVGQKITHFRHDSGAPLSLTILLDVSGSMALEDKMTDCREALKHFVSEVLRPYDEAALLIFADGDVEVASGYAEDKAGLLDVLAKTEAYGKTALNDAVAVSPEFARKGKNEKRALLLITDGIENDSQYSRSEASEIATEVEVPIYTIGYKMPLNDRLLAKHKRAPGMTPSGIVESLEHFSRATGGKAFFANNLEGLVSALKEIRAETGQQYLMSFTSYAEPEEFRKIRVATKNPKYIVRAREGH